jgi:hypothetical protein
MVEVRIYYFVPVEVFGLPKSKKIRKFSYVPVAERQERFLKIPHDSSCGSKRI